MNVPYNQTRHSLMSKMPTYNPYPDEHIQNYVKPASGLKKCVYVYKNDRTKFDLTNRMKKILQKWGKPTKILHSIRSTWKDNEDSKRNIETKWFSLKALTPKDKNLSGINLIDQSEEIIEIELWILYPSSNVIVDWSSKSVIQKCFSK